MQESELLEGVCRVARGAGALIREIRRPQVFSKEGHANFVTSADMASQEYILERLAPMLPKAHFLAEEQEDRRLMPGDNWIIDPIDGTTNFMRGIGTARFPSA